jgi:DNA mismatch endonuclease, patch repair protein
MIDIVDQKTRSRMMSGIRGKNTKPEVVLRKKLHAMGFRFNLHRRDLPGCPDIVLPKHNASIFVHGCYWHRHDGCHLATNPASNADFWQMKFTANRERDARNLQDLAAMGWRLAVVWECSLRKDPDSTAIAVADWLTSETTQGMEI